MRVMTLTRGAIDVEDATREELISAVKSMAYCQHESMETVKKLASLRHSRQPDVIAVPPSVVENWPDFREAWAAASLGPWRIQGENDFINTVT